MLTPGVCRIKRNDLPSVLCTLCSYENLFGPYHPHTLRLIAEAGVAFWHHGEFAYARPLLERAVRDVGRYLGREDEARLRALAALRDLLLKEYDYERARATQMELLECQTGGLEPQHLGTVDAPEDLATSLLALDRVPSREN
jgi:hypothetical protein